MTTATTTPTVRLRLSARARRAVLTAHIVSSVGLLGDVAGFLVVAVRGAAAQDPSVARAYYETLDTFSIMFGIPLSLTALGTGIVLGLSSHWGVLRHGWVTAKLALILSVILTGAFVNGPSVAAVLDGSGGREETLIFSSAYQLGALLLATGVSVYKPRRRISRAG